MRCRSIQDATECVYPAVSDRRSDALDDRITRQYQTSRGFPWWDEVGLAELLGYPPKKTGRRTIIMMRGRESLRSACNVASLNLNQQGKQVAFPGQCRGYDPWSEQVKARWKMPNGGNWFVRLISTLGASSGDNALCMKSTRNCAGERPGRLKKILSTQRTHVSMPEPVPAARSRLFGKVRIVVRRQIGEGLGVRSRLQGGRDF